MLENTNDEIEYIYRRYITIKGKRIYPSHGKCFRIPIKKK